MNVTDAPTFWDRRPWNRCRFCWYRGGDLVAESESFALFAWLGYALLWSLNLFAEEREYGVIHYRVKPTKK